LQGACEFVNYRLVHRTLTDARAERIREVTDFAREDTQRRRAPITAHRLQKVRQRFALGSHDQSAQTVCQVLQFILCGFQQEAKAKGWSRSL
jgi:hypothetical protein